MLRTASGTLVQWFVHFSVILLLAGTPVPGVNESHYLPKAKHAWDSEYAPGDLFLESHDSHLLSTWVAGGLTTLMPLDAVAWVGRLVAWALMAAAWSRLGNSLKISPLLSPFTLAAWLLATRHLHWAGEWAVGGFEGKAIAYPLIAFGLNSAILGRWQQCWLWLGAAMAWHPLVGGWAGLSLGLVWIFGRSRMDWRRQLPWLAGGALLGLIGVLPALSGIEGTEREGKIVASQIHVYMRLAHHLCPLTFPPERHWAAVVSLLALMFATGAVWVAYTSRRSAQRGSPSVSPISLLLRVAWWAVAFAAVGLAVDLLLSAPDRSTHQPLVASKILRFYWFRWADIAVPLAWTCSAAWLLSTFSRRAWKRRAPERMVASRFAACFSCAVVALISIRSVASSWDTTIPPADKILVSNLSVDSPQAAEQRYIDWLAVCSWIRNNTPTDSLWLTPKYQQTFKWYAARAEVVCWKDVPQDSESVIEWYQRITDLEPPRRPTANGMNRLRARTREELLQLSRKYGFQWVLVDRSLYAQDQPPPLLEIAYPVDGIPNDSFAVFRIPQ